MTIRRGRRAATDAGWYQGVMGWMLRQVPAVTGALVLLGVAELLAQGQTPVFRTGVDLVRFDVSVLDKNRKPVRGLSQADFVVIEDGKEQAIVAFSEVVVPDKPLDAAGWLSRAAVDVRTNALANRRLMVIVVDDAIMKGPDSVVRTKEAAKAVIDGLGPNDLAAMVFTADNRNPEDFTTDRSRLYAALDRLNIGSGFGTSGLSELFNQYTVGTLYRVSEFLRDAPEAKKAIVYISPGIPFNPVVNSQAAFEVRHEVDELLKSARLSNINIYSLWTGIDVAGEVESQGLKSFEEEFLHMLGANTGGFAHTAGTYQEGVAKILAETSSYYVLGYSPAHVDGRVHQVVVRSRRPDVTIVSRREYVLSDRKSTVESSPLVKAMAGIVPYPDLPLAVNVVPIAHPDAGERVAGRALLAVTVSASVPMVTTRTTKTVDVLVSVFDPEGRPRGQKKQTAEVVLRPAVGDRASFEVVTTYPVKVGQYNVRVSALDRSDGKSGSVYTAVSVPDYSREPLSTSGLFLRVQPSLTSAPKDALAGIFGYPPTTVRSFSTTDRVDFALRVYRPGLRAQSGLTAEVVIRDSTDQVLSTTLTPLQPECFGTGLGGDKPLGCEYAGKLDVASMKKGDYLLVVTISSPDGRSVRKEVRFSVA